MTVPPKYPEVDISLLQSGTPWIGPTGPTYGDPNFGIPNTESIQEVDITLLPGVLNQQIVSYKHTQNASSNSWTIHHNLNFYPNVTVFDSSGTTWQEGNQVEGNVVHVDNRTLTIHFSVPISGTAILS